MEIHFAPVQGQTDLVYRNIFDKVFGGADCYYTPLIRLEKGRVRNKDLREASKDANTVKRLVPQILAGDSGEFRELAGRIRELGYDRIDINLGCPFPLITGAGKGAGILPHAGKVEEMLNTVKEFPGIRFSVKARLGYKEAGELAALVPYLNTLPLEHITVHPRTASQQYKGVPDMDMFGKIYEMCSLPLFYSGDIVSKEDFDRLVSKFPALKGVMLGRGLLANPGLASDIGGNPLDDAELKIKIRAFHSALFSAYSGLLQGDRQILSRMQALWTWLRMPGGDGRMLKKLMKCTTMANYNAYAAAYMRL